MTNELDAQISDAVGLVGLLLVFVAGYLTATWTNASELMARPVPDVAADRKRLRARVKATQTIAVGALIAIIAVLALLIKLSKDVVARINLHQGYDTLRAGLVLVDLFLVSLAIAAGVLIKRLAERAKTLE